MAIASGVRTTVGTIGRTRLVVVAMSLLAPVPILLGQFVGGGVNPLAAPISHYVYQPGGFLMVLAGALLLAGCGVAIGLQLIKSSFPLRGPVDRRRRVAAAVLISYAIALLVVGLVPTDPPDSATASSAEIVHRLGVVWAFLSLPIAGTILVRAPNLVRPGIRPTLIRYSAGLLAGLVLFVSVQLPLLVAGSGIPALGAVERIAFALMIGYLILLATALRPGLDRPVEGPARLPR